MTDNMTLENVREAIFQVLITWNEEISEKFAVMDTNKQVKEIIEALGLERVIPFDASKNPDFNWFDPLWRIDLLANTNPKED